MVDLGEPIRGLGRLGCCFGKCRNKESPVMSRVAVPDGQFEYGRCSPRKYLPCSSSTTNSVLEPLGAGFSLDLKPGR
ncbi:hypothetical protein R1flu_007055 [Riccia fluitans]|uniref:Uncharacterized protein n=1 Tax=Riccia fluitans TaxID=41844 RepID=A0ABD1YXS8_9MARC